MKLRLATEPDHLDVAYTEHEVERFFRRVPCASRGKYLALRALAHARCGATSLSLQTAREAVNLTVSPEARCLARFATVVASAASEGDQYDAQGVTADAFKDAQHVECLDSVVVAYRSYPALLRSLTSDERTRPAVEELVRRSNDIPVADAAGIEIQQGTRLNTINSLTNREQEVMRLLGRGLSTEEISNHLFISRSTTKVHIHHIFRKLGVSNRLDAILMWRDSCAPY